MTLAIDDTVGPVVGPRGRWSPGTGSDVLFTRAFLQVDEQSYWLQSKVGKALLRMPRSCEPRVVQDGFECPGWLLDADDDRIWCAEDHDESIEIWVLDKTGYGEPALAAKLSGLEPDSLHPSLDHQGPLVIGERVVMAVGSGFVSAELEGDPAVEFIELGHRPTCVVAQGERLAWRVDHGNELYSGQLPLTTIRREYADDRLLGCPAWAGDSLLILVHEQQTVKLARLTEGGGLLWLETVPSALNELVSDGQQAWWLVRGQGLWWIDATSHGRVDTAEIFPHTMTADGGLLAWMTDVPGGLAIRVSGDLGQCVAER